MAKRKRAAHEEPFSRSAKKSAVDLAVAENPSQEQNEVAAPFVGQWNRLVSTTNWEKGKIICEWRQALIDKGASVTEYSDESWAQLVGGVTSQHVGRLRRVYQRFGDVADQYDTLHWSHFQASLDWDDAEMWLEGSIQNDWSVSQMRGRRWETVGATTEQQQAEIAQETAEQDSEANAEAELAVEPAAVQPTNSSVNALADTADSSDGASTNDASNSGNRVSSERSPLDSAATTDAAGKRTRLSIDVESLPDDLAEAFESFKLAIIAHRRENWRDTTPESVIECLDSLKQLALAE